MNVIVDLTAATICYLNVCHPVLIGQNTPTGDYALTQRITSAPGYGGDVLQFKDDVKIVYAIHRLWTLKPEQHRLERLTSPTTKDNYITSGCINVALNVYEELLAKDASHLTIVK